MKIKFFIRIALETIAGALVGLFLWALIRHDSDTINVDRMPVFQALDIYGEVVEPADMLDSSKRTAVMFFSPDCEFCRKELEGIIARRSEFKNIQWLFISRATQDELEEFLMEYPLGIIPDSYVLRDDSGAQFQIFGVKGPPALFVFDTDGTILYTHRGAVSIKIIAEELK